MKKILLGLLVLNSVSVFANEADCRTQVRDLRKEIATTERNNVEVISYLSSTGEYLVKSGRSIKAVINTGSRLSASTGDTLVYSGQQVIQSASNSLSNNTIQIDKLTQKLDALEDCMY